MRAIKLISLFAAAFSSLSLRAQLAGPAGPPANLATNRPPYVTQVKRVGGPGLIPAGARPQFNQAGRETEG